MQTKVHDDVKHFFVCQCYCSLTQSEYFTSEFELKSYCDPTVTEDNNVRK